jgi:hypothetical protein
MEFVARAVRTARAVGTARTRVIHVKTPFRAIVPACALENLRFVEVPEAEAGDPNPRGGVSLPLQFVEVLGLFHFPVGWVDELAMLAHSAYLR